MPHGWGEREGLKTRIADKRIGNFSQLERTRRGIDPKGVERMNVKHLDRGQKSAGVD